MHKVFNISFWGGLLLLFGGIVVLNSAVQLALAAIVFGVVLLVLAIVGAFRLSLREMNASKATPKSEVTNRALAELVFRIFLS